MNRISLSTLSLAAGLTAVVVDADSDPYPALLRVLVAALPGVDGAVLCGVKAGRPVTIAAHGPADERFTSAQRRLGQGPTVQAFKDRRSVASSDVTHDVRWPQLSPVMESMPVRAVLCCPLGRAPRLMMLTLYGARPSTLDQFDAGLLRLVLAHTEIALAGLAQPTRAVNLQRAQTTNERISVAIGILMSNGYSEVDAVAAMSAASQSQNRRLADVAEDVILTGALDQQGPSNAHDTPVMDTPHPTSRPVVSMQSSRGQTRTGPLPGQPGRETVRMRPSGAP